MTNRLDFSLTTSNGKIELTSGPATAIPGIKAILTLLAERNAQVYAKLGTAKTFSATLQTTNQSITLNIDATIPGAPKFLLTLPISREQADHVNGITPPPTTFPTIPLLITAGGLITAAAFYYAPWITSTVAGGTAILAAASTCSKSETKSEATPSAPAVITRPVVTTPPVVTTLALPPVLLAPISSKVEDVIGIVNGGPKGGDSSTCFMNAAFQLIMNDEELLRAILETYQTELKKSDLPADNRTAYIAFINAVIAYKAGNRDGVDLNPLRKIFYNAKTAGVQGDSSEVIFALLGPVDVRKYPRLFTPQTIEKMYVPEPKLTFPASLWSSPTTYKLVAADKREEFSIISPNRIMQDHTQPAYALQVPLSGETNGTKLIELQFQQHPCHNQTERAGYYASEAAKQAGIRSPYVPTEERTILSNAPDRFLVDLKRFQNVLGVRTKIKTEIDMPQELTVMKTRYRLKSIVVHAGEVTGGHYYAYVRKGNGPWKKANDSDSRDATDLDHGLKNGYLYWYEKI
jgi:hypothetical protein